jgi:putative Tad-like protein involved in Flp pilus assembly
MSRTRLKARRGTFIILTALLMMSMVSLAALAVDFARISSLKSELVISADASAMAAGVEMLPLHSRDTLLAADSARSYAKRNKAMQDTVRFESITWGHWDPVAQTFTAGGLPNDAVKTVVSRQSNGLFMSGLGVAMPRIRATATAWFAAPISGNGCIKPWAIPYPILMSRINIHNGVANTPANLQRAFTPADLDTLLAMTPAERAFDMHLGNGTSNLDSLNITGNYQAVSLAQKYYDAYTGVSNSNPQTGGAQEYRDEISGAVCRRVTIGDTLRTFQGLAGAQNTVDPLVIQGSPPAGLCETIEGYTNRSIQPGNPVYGDCRTAGVAPTIVAMFYLCVTGCTGSSAVAVKMMGAFQLDKIYSDNNNTYNTTIAQIKGTFIAKAAPGPVLYTGGSAPVVKIVLVQ